jgi:hypothetical protein
MVSIPMLLPVVSEDGLLVIEEERDSGGPPGVILLAAARNQAKVKRKRNHPEGRRDPHVLSVLDQGVIRSASSWVDHSKLR